MKNSFKLLVFDCDGVLLDSRLANQKYYNYLLKKTGRAPLTEEELEYVHIHSLPECLDFLFKAYPELKEKAIELAKNTPYDKFFSFMKMEEGLIEFLEWAFPKYYLAICTNRTTSIFSLLKYFNLEKYFSLVRTALDYPKSNPQALKSILDYFRLSPSQSLYLGDSKIDEALCLACSVPFLSYKNPNLKALKIIEHYRELKNFLE